MNLRRFDALTRLVHWLTATLALGLLGTGTILYVGQLEAAIGRRALLAAIHLWCGLLLPVPLLAGILLGRVGAGLRADLHELTWWTANDLQRLRRAARRAPDGKFNGGQKAATCAFGGLLAALLLTGALMHWNHPFPDEWRTGATFVHDWGYVALGLLTLGHIGKALQEPELLTAITRGTVPVEWAEHERPAWARRARSLAHPASTSEED